MKKFIINLTDPNKNLTYIFTANIERGDDGRVLISCPSLPVYTEGADEAEAKKNIVEAVTMFLECSADAGHLEDVLEDHIAPAHYGVAEIDRNPAPNIKISMGQHGQAI